MTLRVKIIKFHFESDFCKNLYWPYLRNVGERTMAVNRPPFLLPVAVDRMLYKWGLRFIDRFPMLADSRLLKGLYALLGAVTVSFLEEKSLFHLKYLLMIQMMLQKKVERYLKQNEGRSICARVFHVDSRLCVAVAYFMGEQTLSYKTIFKIASQKIPALKEVGLSPYQWTNQDSGCSFCYLELEKMRGKNLTGPERKALESYLEEQLNCLTCDATIFWPYNEEEAFKQILTLAREITSPKDVPQVSLQLQQQTQQHIEFLVYLARPKRAVTAKTAIASDHFPASTPCTVLVKKELDLEIPVLAEAFSLLIPVEKCIRGATIHLLIAREWAVKLLERVIGLFRDYNGGLFETQKKRFGELSDLFAKKITSFSLFGENLFYSLAPVEARICLGTSLFEKVFAGVAESLLKSATFLTRPSPHVLVLKTQDLEEFSAWVERVKRLQEKGKVTAYAPFKVLTEHYLCLVDDTGHHLGGIRFNHKRKPAAKKQRVLRLAFQQGEIFSFSPYYLAKETRGRTVAHLLFEGLFRLGPCRQVEHAGCESSTLSKDKKSYLFKLRPHFWSSGQKVTAFQYERTWKRNLLAKEHLNPFYVLKHASAVKKKVVPIESLGVKAVNDDLLQVELEEEDTDFLEKLTHPLFFPTLEENTEAMSFNGPYCIRKKGGSLLVLEKNVYYWDQPRLFFDEIAFTFDLSSEEVFRQFKQKESDWIGYPCTYDAPLPESFHVQEASCSFFIYFNTQFSLLASPFIRQALSCVIDRRFIAESIFPGSRPLFSMPPFEFSCDEPVLVDRDLAQGKQLFEQGLHTLGLTTGALPRFKISVCKFEQHIHLAKYLQKQWQDIFGLSIDLDIREWNVFYQKMDQGAFHIGGFFAHLFPFDAISFLKTFCDQEDNFSQWEHPDFSALMALAKDAASWKMKKRHLTRARQFFFNHLPVIPLIVPSYTYAHRSGLKHYAFGRDGSLELSFASNPSCMKNLL